MLKDIFRVASGEITSYCFSAHTENGNTTAINKQTSPFISFNFYMLFFYRIYKDTHIFYITLFLPQLSRGLFFTLNPLFPIFWLNTQLSHCHSYPSFRPHELFPCCCQQERTYFHIHQTKKNKRLGYTHNFHKKDTSPSVTSHFCISKTVNVFV